jgi:MFS family permease
VATVFPSLEIRRSGWRDLFIARELAFVPSGIDRYAMLIVKALAACLGTWIISVGPVASLLIPSEHFSVSTYGYITGGAGIIAGFVSLLAADLADKFSRIRVLLWGMIAPIGVMFALAFMPDGQPALFVGLYVIMAWTEAYAVVTVSALLRDFSPRTGRAVGVGLVTVGTLAANWGTAFMAGHLLASAGTWQHMYLEFAYVAVGLWIACWLFGREPIAGIRNQVLPRLEDAATIQANAQVLEARGVHTEGFWDYIKADWRLWALAAAQGTFLLGYITFVGYGPLFTIAAFHKSPQEGSSLTSWVFLSIIVFLVLGGILSDKLRLRKALGFGFTILSGGALITLGFLSNANLSDTTIIIIYLLVGLVMACMWSPTNALFSETAEDIHASRQTTAFGGQQVISRPIYQAWLFVVPIVLAHEGWRWVWIIAGIGALVTAPILVICRGSWKRFTLQEVTLLSDVPVTVPAAGTVIDAPVAQAATDLGPEPVG